MQLYILSIGKESINLQDIYIQLVRKGWFQVSNLTESNICQWSSCRFVLTDLRRELRFHSPIFPSGFVLQLLKQEQLLQAKESRFWFKWIYINQVVRCGKFSKNRKKKGRLLVLGECHIKNYLARKRLQSTLCHVSRSEQQ